VTTASASLVKTPAFSAARLLAGFTDHVEAGERLQRSLESLPPERFFERR
jgi:hypothetical protein